MEMQGTLNELYALQGKCERIKKFPLPRQHGGMSVIFVGLFIVLLPFGMASEFIDLGAIGMCLSVLFTVIVGWVYMVTELVGDYSENPF
jgi:putative membrane protein